MILVTGGAGFIGANFVLDWLAQSDEPVVNLDKLTYAGNLNNLASLRDDARHVFVKGDIGDTALVASLLATHRPRAVLHFAAESHVDRSILGPAAFIETNVNGTFALLEAVRAYWGGLPEADKSAFRFLHVSTDEVYGTLGPDDAPFTETTAYAPNSPYSASKAASDHLVRAYHHTYGLPTLTTNCSNNYGPYHFPEKLIPLIITNARAGKALPIYGDGQQVRDWLYVSDHCAAIRRVLAAGRPGETYNIGGWNEMANLDVVHTLCDILDVLDPKESASPYAGAAAAKSASPFKGAAAAKSASPFKGTAAAKSASPFKGEVGRGMGCSYRDQITTVTDRPGHDRRYAIDAGKIERELGWKPAETFASGIRKTVQWYLGHQEWVRDVQSGDYLKWVEKQYGL